MPRVLFIEDEPEMVEDAPAVLRTYGLEVVATESSTEGMRLFANGGFDAVLLDCIMPPPDDVPEEQVDFGRETGVEVAKRIRIQDPKVPIVVLSVVRDPAIERKLYAAGVRTIIPKPADPEPVASQLLNAIQRAGASRKE